MRRGESEWRPAVHFSLSVTAQLQTLLFWMLLIFKVIVCIRDIVCEVKLHETDFKASCFKPVRDW